MTTVTSLPISLAGIKTVVATVTSTPTNILGNPLANGRYLLRVIDIDNLKFIGSADFLFIQNNPVTFSSPSSAWFLTDTSGTNWHLAYNDIIFTFTYVDNLFYVASDTTFNNLDIRVLLLPSSYGGNNIYGIDNIQAANPVADSPININSPIVFTPTASNAVNFGQVAVTQTTSISTAVTANGGSGMITTVSATTPSWSTSSFTVNNSAVSATSVIIANLCNYTGTTLSPQISISSIASGSFVVNITNQDTMLNPLNGVCKIGFFCC